MMLLVGFLAVSLLGKGEAVRDARAAGMTLNDWCDNGFAKCMMTGAECKDPEKQCKCKPQYVPYNLGGLDRCAPKMDTAFGDADCEFDEDCSQGYGKYAVCKLQADGTGGKCACAAGYAQDGGTKQCTKFDCRNDRPRCNTITDGSTCVDAGPNAGRCMCPLGKILKDNRCVDLATVLNCDEQATPAQYCPEPITGALKCSPTKKCVCEVRDSAGNLQPGSPAVNPDSQNLIDCKVNTIGSECDARGTCPLNSECMGLGGPGSKGRCTCNEYHKLVTVGTPAVQTCVAAVGTCCRSLVDCGMQPTLATAGKLTCLKAIAGDPKGVCVCARSFGWNAAQKTCTAGCT